MGSAALAALFVVALGAPQTAPNDGSERELDSRFKLVRPLPGLPAITIDYPASQIGIAQALAREHQLQARILWVDATANLVRLNDDWKVARLVQRAQSVGFNTIVLDIKPIVGHTLYPSAFAPKLDSWRGVDMPPRFDPLAAMVRECKKSGMPLLVSMNAFSEGHRIAQFDKIGPAGPGLAKRDRQSVLYEADVRVIARETASEFDMADEPNSPMPEGGESLVAFTSASRVPRIAGEHRLVLVDATGRVVAYTTSEPIRSGEVGIPSGGSAVLGVGPGFEFLKTFAKVGDQLDFIHSPLFVPTSERMQQQIPLMMNPHHPEVADRMIAMVEEVLTKYAVDGLLFDDRLRFAGQNADFSQQAKRAFEAYVGERVAWPHDAFSYAIQPDLERGVVPGRLYDAWLSFRAHTMQQFVQRVRGTVDRVRPGTKFGVYAGSWYGEYASYGSNYASNKLVAGFPFLTDRYRPTGFAESLDMVITGCYYAKATIAEAMSERTGAGATVEAAAMLSNRVVRDAAWTYAGLSISSFRGDNEAFARCLQAALVSSQGVMVFDLSHDIEPLWPIFERAFRVPAVAPHKRPDVLSLVRHLRQVKDDRGETDPPIVIYSGVAGIGH